MLDRFYKYYYYRLEFDLIKWIVDKKNLIEQKVYKKKRIER